MAEQPLDRVEVGSGFQEMGGKGMAQGVDAAGLCDAGCCLGGVVDAGCRLPGDRLVLLGAREEPGFWPMSAPVAAKLGEHGLRQETIAVLAALALVDPQGEPFAVDVGDLEADHLTDAHARAI